MAENTLDELRRQIAERLGWTEFTHKGPRGGFLYGIDPQEGYARIVPDWPRDAGAALALCEQIADDNDWRIVIKPQKYVSFEAFAYTYSKWQEAIVEFMTDDGDRTEALARLALAALNE